VISVVVPVKNGGDDLRRLLEAVRAQRTAEEVQVVVIDSGSSDGSAELAREQGAEVHAIAPGEFNHGRTRNLGVSLARGDTIIFTVQDALPVGETWLASLTAPLHDGPQLAGAYSRQLAREGAPPYQRYYIDYRYGPEPRVQAAASAEELTPGNTLFSNVASAIPRPILEQFPFAEDVVTGEDLEWCRRVLLAGHRVAYVPEAEVRHSHDYSAPDAFRRYFDQGVGAQRSFMGPDSSSPRAVRGEGTAFVRRELGWLRETGQARWIPRTLAHEAWRYLAFQAGRHHALVPPPLRRRLSATPSYWTQ
jgi:rhamnosyltransferase